VTFDLPKLLDLTSFQPVIPDFVTSLLYEPEKGILSISEKEHVAAGGPESGKHCLNEKGPKNFHTFGGIGQAAEALIC